MIICDELYSLHIFVRWMVLYLFFCGRFVICSMCSSSSVTWRKSSVEIRSDAFHVVKAEGEKHSLVIKQMRPSDAGSYHVTAVNPAGRASCDATLFIQSGEARTEMGGGGGTSRDVKAMPLTHTHTHTHKL